MMFTVNITAVTMVYRQCYKVTHSIDHSNYGFGLQCECQYILTFPKCLRIMIKVLSKYKNSICMFKIFVAWIR